MEKLYTMEEAAAALNFSTRSIKRWIIDGQILSVSFGGRARRVHPDELEHIRRNGLREKNQVPGLRARDILGSGKVAVQSARRSRQKEQRLWLN